MENKKRLIDANAFWNLLQQVVYDIVEHDDFGRLQAGYSPDIIEKVLKQIPTVHAVEVAHGRWEEIGVADYKCSRCGFRFTSADHISMFQYCRCGAKMDGGNEED